MSEDPFSLDSLLEDLDAAVHSPQTSTQPAGGTMKFVPHPPARDKQTSHTTTFNPKNRFAVQPSSASTSPEAPHDSGNNRNSQRFAYGSPDKPVSAYGSAVVAPSSSSTQSKMNRTDPDENENSLDNLLNLISSPSQAQSSAAKPAQAAGGAFSYAQPSSSALNSQFFLESQKVGSGAGHSGRFPSMTDHTTNNTTTYNINNNTPTYNNITPYTNTTTTNNNTTNNNAYNNTAYINNTHVPNSGYVAQTIAPDSNMSSPFDSPSSHGSAQKTFNSGFNAHNSTYHTHSGSFGHNTHSTSMYNMSSNTTNTNNTTNNSAYVPNLASSFDSAESGDRVPALFNTNNTNNTSANNNTNNAYSSNTVVYGSGSNSHLQPITTSTDSTYANKSRSGTGVSGGLFGSTSTTNTTSNSNTHTDNHHSYTNAVSPRGNTATFTSQNAQNSSLRAQNEPSKAQSSHFLPTNINATTVVSNSSAGASSGSGGSSGAAKQKCSRVVIGGISIPRGRKTSAFANFACNNLRCLQCNFKVHCFSNSEWDSTVDYMFLRNTVPNEAKLAVKLTRSAEKCAYCCQCSSASEGGERELNATLSAQGPQWVCAGH